MENSKIKPVGLSITSKNFVYTFQIVMTRCTNRDSLIAVRLRGLKRSLAFLKILDVRSEARR